MKHVFVFDRISVIVGPWHEPMDPPERGTRVEVRLLAEETMRGTRSAAQRIVVDQPVFRADLFDQTDKQAGNLRAAHFHPRFDGVEPCDRVWDDAIQRDPTGWLKTQLDDLDTLLTNAGIDTATASWVESDARALRDAIPTVIAAVEATWSVVRSDR